MSDLDPGLVEFFRTSVDVIRHTPPEGLEVRIESYRRCIAPVNESVAMERLRRLMAIHPENNVLGRWMDALRLAARLVLGVPDEKSSFWVQVANGNVSLDLNRMIVNPYHGPRRIFWSWPSLLQRVSQQPLLSSHVQGWTLRQAGLFDPRSIFVPGYDFDAISPEGRCLPVLILPGSARGSAPRAAIDAPSSPGVWGGVDGVRVRSFQEFLRDLPPAPGDDAPREMTRDRVATGSLDLGELRPLLEFGRASLGWSAPPPRGAEIARVGSDRVVCLEEDLPPIATGRFALVSSVTGEAVALALFDQGRVRLRWPDVAGSGLPAHPVLKDVPSLLRAFRARRAESAPVHAPPTFEAAKDALDQALRARARTGGKPLRRSTRQEQEMLTRFVSLCDRSASHARSLHVPPGAITVVVSTAGDPSRVPAGFTLSWAAGVLTAAARGSTDSDFALPRTWARGRVVWALQMEPPWDSLPFGSWETEGLVVSDEWWSLATS